MVVNTESMGSIISNSMANWYVIFVLTTKFLGNNSVGAITIYRINLLVKTMCFGTLLDSEFRGAKGKQNLYNLKNTAKSVVRHKGLTSRLLEIYR